VPFLPPPPPPPLTLRHQRAGFSLVELLLVVAVMGILMALAVPSLSSITSGRRLDLAGSQMADSLSLARQTAMARGCRVRWELARIGTPPLYQIHRLLEFRTGGWQPSTKWTALPDAVQLSTNSLRAGLLASPTNTVLAFTYQGTNYPVTTTCIPITFLPDGTTDLQPGNNNFLTLEPTYATRDASGNTRNWFSIVINPVTGRTEIFRP